MGRPGAVTGAAAATIAVDVAMAVAIALDMVVRLAAPEQDAAAPGGCRPGGRGVEGLRDERRGRGPRGGGRPQRDAGPAGRACGWRGTRQAGQATAAGGTRRHPPSAGRPASRRSRSRGGAAALAGRAVRRGCTTGGPAGGCGSWRRVGGRTLVGGRVARAGHGSGCDAVAAPDHGVQRRGCEQEATAMLLYLKGGRNCRDSRVAVGRAAAMRRGRHPCRCPDARDGSSRIVTIDNK